MKVIIHFKRNHVKDDTFPYWAAARKIEFKEVYDVSLDQGAYKINTGEKTLIYPLNMISWIEEDRSQEKF